MDDDDLDFDDLFADGEPKEQDRDGPPDEPTWRAVVRGDEVTLIHWMPWLMHGPGARLNFDAREQAGVSVADLTTIGSGFEREVIVDFRAHGGGVAAEKALERWAKITGYLRIWFPKRVVVFDECSPLRTATVTCPTCGHDYREREAQFWVTVQDCGQFPNWCLLCGGDLPQWEARRTKT